MSRVAMFVRNDATRDSRVLREAATLTQAGHQVTIMAVNPAAGGLPLREERDGFEIVRVELPSSWRLIPAWIRAPWRLRGRAVASFKRALRDGPAGWFRAALILIACVLSIPWMIIRAALHVARGRSDEARRGRLDWLLAWQFGTLAWARDAGRAAPPSDIYHGHDLTGLAAAVVAADRTPGIVVYDSHEIFLESGTYAELPGWIRRWIGRLERRLAGRATAVVTVNPMIGVELERRMPVRRLVIVHNCPPRWEPRNPPADLIRAAAGIPSGVPLLLYHGGFSAHRGLEQIAESILEPGLETAHAVYLGYGSQRPMLDRLVLEPRFGGRLHVLDAVDPDVLLDWVAGADVGVIPGQPSTLNHLLSSPNKLFEALAAGVPVVIMDFPYVHRIVLDDPGGPFGAVCDPADPASIAAAVRAIIELPPAERDALRARCLAIAHDRWNWETESVRLVTLYEELAAQAGASSGSTNRGTGTAQSS
ncbi:MAG TPA: glycosyltransferase [Candidatus Deferrimicrobium sp.]|nr:glycosyltransferase [Candidatus Deferrimicrobium sp.]